MISLSELNYEILWNITRTQKLNYIIENVHTLTSGVCFSLNDEDFVLEQQNIESKMDSIEKELILAGSQHINHDINKILAFEAESYERAAKMFIYLNFCPKFMFDWTQLYINLFQNSPLDLIIQTANRIMVTAYSKNDRIVALIGGKIGHKLYETFQLKFYTIDKFIKGDLHDSTDFNDNFITTQNKALKVEGKSTTENPKFLDQDHLCTFF